MIAQTFYGRRPFLAAAMLIALPAAAGAGSAKPVSLSSPACKAFRDQTFPSNEPGKKGAATEQIVIIREGKAIFEWNEDALKKDTARPMWSISKTVTATLVATAVHEGKIKLDDPIAKYLPEIANDPRVDSKRFKKIRVRDLLAMSSGIKWAENDKVSTREQSILDLLYSKGYRDAASYLGRQPFAAEPGTQWNYASVNAVLAMAVLKKAYGTEASDMPWNKLFGPLGMKSVRFEKDRSGTYVGGAYVHMPARDLAKLGQLYLNDGVWNGKRLLPENWVNSVAAAPVAMTQKNIAGLKQFNLPTVYSQGGFWLNKSPGGGPRPYPNLPESMLLTTGVQGQTLIILPEQNMIISRTAHDPHDAELPLDASIGNALRCFAPGSPGVASDRHAIPPKASGFKSMNAKEAFEGLDSLNYLGEEGRLSGLIAKEMCSCHFISGLESNECIRRSPVPVAMAHLLNDIQVDEAAKSVTVRPRFGTVPALARMNKSKPREGCRMGYGYADHVKQ
jgi:CubicO group peptidase (beta-lactamase class C family)